MRIVLCLLGTTVCVFLAHGNASAATVHVDREGLVRVITPDGVSPAPAHPGVNVIVRFGATSTGAGADVATFRARLNGSNIGPLFRDDVENGVLVGRHAAVPANVLQSGPHGRNLLKVRIRAMDQTDATGHRHTYRDADVLRFATTAKPNVPASCAASAGASQVVPGREITFDASASRDLEHDPISFSWAFGDGATATGPVAGHAFGDTPSPATVTLTCNDGQADSVATIVVSAPAPSCDPGAVPGQVAVSAVDPLEFGPVPLGETRTKTFVVANADVTPGSQVKVRIDVEGAGFSVDQSSIALAAGETRPVVLRFASVSAGHQSARITLVACETAQTPTTMVAHAYGGAGEGDGPIPTIDPLVFTEDGLGLGVLLPGGRHVALDLNSGNCRSASNGSSYDLCYGDADCRAAGESCTAMPVRAGFDPTDFCGDGAGNVFLLVRVSVIVNTSIGSSWTRGSAHRERSASDAGRVG